MLTAQDLRPPDSLFQSARTAAAEGKYEASRLTCREILSRDSLYHDARILLASTYAWDQEYDSARTELQTVLGHQPENIDALTALANVERWSGNPRLALDLTDEALHLSPGSTPLQFQKAEILASLGERTQAEEVLHTVLRSEPDHAGAQRLLASLVPQPEHLATLRLGADADAFDRPDAFGPWHQLYASYARLLGPGLFELRGRYAGRDYGTGTQTGGQIELDGYPRLTEKSYLFVNAGYSPHDVFPRIRLGFEYFTGLGEALEASAGVRYFDFRQEKPVQLTLSGALYLGNYWSSFRSFVNQKGSRMYATGVFQLRRYFSSAHDFVTFVAAAGSSPLETGTLSDIQRLSAQKAGLEGQFFLTGTTGLRLEISYEREEYRQDTFGNRYSLGFGVIQRL